MNEVSTKVEPKDLQSEDIRVNSTHESRAIRDEMRKWGMLYPYPVTPAAMRKLMSRFARQYGKPPLLPGDSEEAFWNLHYTLANTDLLGSRFELYIAKEQADALMMIRRWRGACTSIVDACIKNPHKIPPPPKPDAATKQLPSPESILDIHCMSADEAATQLAYYGFDPATLTALSVLQTRELRFHLSAREEAAQRNYHRLLDLLNTIREARSQIAAQRSSTEYVKARTKHQLCVPRKKPAMPGPREHRQIPDFVNDGGFTKLARLVLGEPPTLKGESEVDYGELLNDVMGYVGYTEPQDIFLINDVAAATWEKRRLCEVSETIVRLIFRKRAKQMLANSDLPLGQEELAGLQDSNLTRTLQRAGIPVGEVSALTLGELHAVLSAIDDEVVRVDDRRWRSLKAAFKGRANSVKISYFDARRTEITRMHEWKVNEDRKEYEKRYPWKTS